MSNKFKSLIAIGLIALVAACGQQSEPMDEPMVTEEPVHSGKY